MNARLLLITMLLVGPMIGCDSLLSIYGLGGANPNLGDGSGDLSDAGLKALTPINFANDVPLSEDPAMFELAGGSVGFAGGSAGTLGIPSLYFNDSFSWDLAAGGTATITFTGLDVRRVRLYFAHTGETGATIIAADAMGVTLSMAESVAASSLGDMNAVVELDGQGATVSSLTIAVPNGATVAIDQLVVIVPQ